MAELTAQIREWGRSIGIVIPKDFALKSNLKSGDKIKLLILKNKNPLKETFGIAKFSRPTSKILNEVDKEGWDG